MDGKPRKMRASLFAGLEERISAGDKTCTSFSQLHSNGKQYRAPTGSLVFNHWGCFQTPTQKVLDLNTGCFGIVPQFGTHTCMEQG